MRANDDLFYLISSLSRVERGYFSKYAEVHAKGGENNYKRLFSIICSMEEPNEEKLREMLKGDNLLSYLSTAKNQLYNTILRTMRHYNSEYPAESRSIELIQDSDQLAARGLHGQRGKALRRAADFCDEHEVLIARLQLSGKELQRALDADLDPKELKSELERIKKLRAQLLTRISELIELEDVYARFRVAGSGREMKRFTEFREYCDEMLNHPLLSHAESLQSTEAKIVMHLIRGEYAAALHRWNESFNHYSECIQLINGKRDRVTDYPDHYFKALSGYCMAAIRLKRKKEFAHTLTLIRRLSTQHECFTSESRRIEIFVQAQLLEMHLHRELGEFRKWMELAVFLIKEMQGQEYKLNFRMRLEMFLMMSLGMFCGGEWRKSLQLLNRIYSERFENMDKKFIVLVRMLYLLLHFEIGNRDHLQYATKSVLRKLERESMLDVLQKTLIAYIRSHVLKGKRGIRPVDTGKMAKEVYWISCDPDERDAFLYFDFTCWAEAREKKISMIQLMDRRQKMVHKTSAAAATATPV